MLAAYQVQSLLMSLSYHRHAQLQMGKLRHRVPHLATGGIQPVKLFLLGLIGCSWDLGPNVTDPEDAERKRREMPHAFLGGPHAGSVLGCLGRLWTHRAAGSAALGAVWLVPLLASVVSACRGLNDLSQQ